MQATAIAQPNIALVKYWGKRDLDQNLPAVGSISITLRDLFTKVSVDLSGAQAVDRLIVNGQDSASMLPRMSACIDRVLGAERPAAVINSESNFPIAAGLASSASAFAATVVATSAAAGQKRNVDDLSRLAGAASGSAARSLYGGFAELTNHDDRVGVHTLLDEERWPLRVVVAITETGPKPIGSTEAMEISRRTSPFYARWIEQQEEDLRTARQAILQQDFAALAAVSEHNCLKMHSVMWSSRPPLVYWNAATMRCMEVIRKLRSDGARVFFTIDAGPQVKAVCHAADVASVSSALGEIDGVKQVMTSRLGRGACVTS